MTDGFCNGKSAHSDVVEAPLGETLPPFDPMWNFPLSDKNLPYVIIGSESSTRRHYATTVLREVLIPLVFVSPDIDEPAIGRRDWDPEKLTMTLAEAKADALLKALLPSQPITEPQQRHQQRFSSLEKSISRETFPLSKSSFYDIFGVQKPDDASPGLPQVCDLSSVYEARGLYLLTGDQVVTAPINGDRETILEKPRSRDELVGFVRSYSGRYAKTIGSIVLTRIGGREDTRGLITTPEQRKKCHVARVDFSDIPEEVIQDYAECSMAFKCAGGLMVESPLLRPYIRRIRGGEDSVHGLHCDTVKELLAAFGERAATEGGT